MKRMLLKIIVCTTILLNSFSPLFIHADQNISGFDYDNYWSVDAIVSTGQYITTTFKPTRNTRFEFKGKFDDVSVANYMFGVSDTQNVNTNTRFYFMSSLADTNTKARIGTRTYDINVQGTGIFEGYFDNSGYNISYGGNTYSQSVSASTTAVSSTLGLTFFGYNQNGTVSYNKGSTIYYLFTYSNNSNSYTHKWYPAVRKSDNAVGFYDTLTDSFIFKSGLTYLGSTVTQYTITTSVSPSGAGTVTGGGTFDSGSVVQLTATANSGYSFLRWSDNVYDNPRSITVSASQSYEAIFTQNSTPVQQYTITTSVSPSGAGTVTGGGTYDSGTTIILSAAANNGYVFTGWSDGVSSSSRSITVNSDMSFIAQFSEYTPPATTYEVDLWAGEGGEVSGWGTYEAGTVVTISAIPDSGYSFARWSDGSTANPRNITVTSNISLTAYFTQDISNQTLLGCYINQIGYNSINYTAYQVNDYGTGTGNTVGYRFYFTPVIENSQVTSTITYELVCVLNDDYIGSSQVVITGSNNNTLYTKTVYVNGSIFYCRFNSTDKYEAQFNFTVSVSNLVKKPTTQSLIETGNTDSIESENQLSDSNDELNGAIADYNEIESGFNNDLNESLEDIQFDDVPSAWGSNFLTSAQWVSEQYNRMTASTPFGSLIGFSLLLGLALLIIGRVFG